MFSYYGSKSKVIDLYPSPRYDRIIEPFAGSARYSLKWFDRDILLIDKYEVIIKIWHYLQQASPKDILGLPEPEYKDNIRSYNLSEGELLLLSFLTARGVQTPKYIVQKFSDIAEAKKNIASQLFKVRHWVIKFGSYEDVVSEEATWFIDPPYQTGGEYYRVNNADINYSQLAWWCKSRQGQVIVCENTKADWLPFWSISSMNGAYTKTAEAMWCNEFEQLPLFAS